MALDPAPQRWRILLWLTALVAVLSACGGGGGGGGGGVVAPTVTTTAPANGALAVPVATIVSVTFSRAMNPVTTEGAMVAVPNINLACLWNAPDTTITCAPEADLAHATLHTFTIGTGATSAAGASLASAFEFSFTTVDNAVPPGTPACVLGGPALLGACKLGV